MRLAVLSDIHGNLPALEAAYEALMDLRVDHVVVAGDSINWAPFSAQVMQFITSHNWACIRGNHEYYMLDWATPDEPAYRRGWTLPRWLNETMPAEMRHVISSLPDTLLLRYRGFPPLRVFHASPWDHWNGIYPSTSDEEIAKRFSDVLEETVIVGHTHLPMDRQSGRWRILNPGSVGVPLSGIPGAEFMILSSDGGPWQPEFLRIDYDRQRIFDEIERLQYVENHGVTARLILEELKVSRPIVWGFMNWRKKHFANEPESMELAQRFLNDPEARWQHLHPEYHLNLPEHLRV